MKNIKYLVWIFYFFCAPSLQAQFIGNWEQVNTSTLMSGEAAVHQIYKGKMYGVANNRLYVSSDRGFNWVGNIGVSNTQYMQPLGGKLALVSYNRIKFVNAQNDTWGADISTQRPNGAPYESTNLICLAGDSIFAVGAGFQIFPDGSREDTMFFIKSDTLTWQFHEIPVKLPEKRFRSGLWGVKNYGEMLYGNFSYTESPTNHTIVDYLTKSENYGRSWKKVCKKKRYSYTLKGNQFYELDFDSDSADIVLRNLPDTTQILVNGGLTRQSLDRAKYGTLNAQLYTHNDKVYFNGSDGVYCLNGLVWQRVGLWAPNSQGNIFSLYFEADTIWANTSRGIFRYTPTNILWQPRNNGLVTNVQEFLQTSEKDRLLIRLEDSPNGSSKNVYAIAQNNSQDFSLVLETNYSFYARDFSFYDADNIVGYDNKLLLSYDNGLMWDNGTSLPLTQDCHGIVRKDSLLFTALGDKGLVYRSEDGGHTWLLKNNGKPATNASIHNLYLVNGVLYQYKNSALYRSADNGENWTKCNFSNNRGVSYLGPAHYGNEVFVMSRDDSTYFHSLDNGLTWSARKTLPQNHRGQMFNIAGNLFVTEYSGGNSEIYRYSGNFQAMTLVGYLPTNVWYISKFLYGDSLLYVENQSGEIFYATYQSIIVPVTSVKEEVKQPYSLSFRMYPNPARASVTLELPANVNQAQISILDVLGKALMQTSSTESKVNLSLRGLSAGVYFVQVQTPQGSSTKRLLVQ